MNNEVEGLRFQGVYTRVLQQKNRIALPSKICLEKLLPETQFFLKSNKLPETNKNYLQLSTTPYAKVYTTLETDTQSRIVIPQIYLDVIEVSISDTLHMIGLDNSILIGDENLHKYCIEKYTSTIFD